MTPYLDACVAISLFVDDAHSRRAADLIRRCESPILSDLSAAEFSSVLNGYVRARKLSVRSATAIFARFDVWRVHTCEAIELDPADVRAADAMMRLDLGLRTPDALHIAVAHRIRAPLATFDAKLIRDARKLGLTVLED